MDISRNLDPNARYQETHEWARLEDGLYVCGISDFAQSTLLDIVFVELPAVGKAYKRGDMFGAIESVKSANDLYCPLSGEIVEINDALEDAPEIINDDPYGDGWLIKIRASSPEEWDQLLDGPAYDAIAETR